MDSKAWKAILGESAWDHISADTVVSAPDGIKQKIPDEEWAEMVAVALTSAVEVGFVPPTTQPVVSPTGSKVLFPTEDGEGVVPVLTAAGLLNHWSNRGHGWLILRTEQLLRSTAGPLFPWVQAIMIAYEERCRQDVVDPLPVSWRVFVGGTAESQTAIELADALYDQSPKPNPAAFQRVTIAGPPPQQG